MIHLSFQYLISYLGILVFQLYVKAPFLYDLLNASNKINSYYLFLIEAITMEKLISTIA